MSFAGMFLGGKAKMRYCRGLNPTACPVTTELERGKSTSAAAPASASPVNSMTNGVAGLSWTCCGGACACASCHVYVDEP